MIYNRTSNEFTPSHLQSITVRLPSYSRDSDEICSRHKKFLTALRLLLISFPSKSPVLCMKEVFCMKEVSKTESKRRIGASLTCII